MDRDRLRQLADHVDGLAHTPDEFGRRDVHETVRTAGIPEGYRQRSPGFNMRSYVTWVEGGGCGTAACLAGWAVLLWPAEETGELIHEAGAAALGLSHFDADFLFNGIGAASPEFVTPAQAAQACRRLADGVHGERMWQEEQR